MYAFIGSRAHTPVQMRTLFQEDIMKVLVEIRPGEGGADAKLLVETQASIYLRYADRHGLAAEVEDDRHA